MTQPLTPGVLCEVTRSLVRTNRGKQYPLFEAGDIVVYVGMTASGVVWVRATDKERGALIARIDVKDIRALSPLEALALQAEY